jgi:hypothetical protein
MGNRDGDSVPKSEPVSFFNEPSRFGTGSNRNPLKRFWNRFKPVHSSIMHDDNVFHLLWLSFWVLFIK